MRFASVDNPTKEDFGRTRPSRTPGKNYFDVVLANIRGLVRIRDELGVKTTVKLVTVCTKRNIRQLPALARLALDLGVDEWMVQNIQFWGGHESFKATMNGQRTADDEQVALYRECKEILDDKLTFKMWRPGVKHGCTWAETSMYVTVDGYVTPCCNSPDPNKLNFGSLDSESPSTIWNSPRYDEFRTKLRNPDPSKIPDICKGCVIYGGRFKEY